MTNQTTESENTRGTTAAAPHAPDVAAKPAPSKKPTTAPKKRAVARPAAKKPAPVKVGMTFEREYKGKSYSLRAVERDGRVVFQLKGGATYDSRTAAAKAVTKYPSISGPAFWGEGAKSAAK